MQSLGFILCIWFMHLLYFGDHNGDFHTKETWLVKNHSSLKVDGKTNINNFSCNVSSYERANDVMVFEKTNLGCNINSQLQIPVSSFDCYHRIMTKDLQKTLKSDAHPFMIIDIKSFTKFPPLLIQGATFFGNADITLAGVKKNYNISFTFRKTNEENIELIGKKTILFTEFGLNPPSKLGGTIKVKNELDVQFRLFLQKV